MITNLTKHGDSYVLVVDKPLLESLHASPETVFDVFTDGQSLVFVPIGDPKNEKGLQDALEMVHRHFGQAMQRLAE
jgi:antitoxin MazE